MFRSVLLVLCLLCAPTLYPQTEAEDGVIRLEGVEISEQKETTEYITQDRMEREHSEDLWEALRNLPGVIRDGGGGMRNESNFTVRGMDERLVPVFIDGAPMSSPYRGDTDNARFLTADLEDVAIHKGYSSMMLGANTFGGAIIMRTAKPKKPFEALYKINTDFDGAGDVASVTNALGFGTKQKLFYGKAVFQFRDRDHYRLSDKFEPDPINPQGKGERLFSDSRDLKFSLLAGWTPDNGFELNLAYVLQDADKGVSPQEVRGFEPAYDVWTKWMRQSVTLDGVYTGNTWYAKTLFFFDKFDNTLSGGNTYENLVSHDYQAASTYDDYGLGARLEGGIDINSWNNLKAAFTFKQESHRDEKEDGEKTKDIKENFWSLGTEYSVNPWKPLTFSAGLGFDYFQPAEFWSINDLHASANAWMFNAQAGIFYDITENHGLHFTFAKKAHMPTMSVRYSSPGRMINARPNPDLKPEEALHYELGYKGHIYIVDINAALYYSDLFNMLAERTTVAGPLERINAGKTAYYGFELGFSLYLNAWFNAGGSLSLSRYTIKRNEPNIDAVGNYPQTTFNAYLTVHPLPNAPKRPLSSLAITPSIEYEGARYGSTHMININAANVLPAYFLLHLRLSTEINDSFSLSAGIENLLDENYVLNNDALPMAGRSYTVSFTARY
ncbi:ligand-gated channel [Spirochaetia bacterium]|nr:ligand-gated channel [Spirochaetia bacterium]